MTTVGEFPYSSVKYRDNDENRVYYTRTVAPTSEPVTVDEAIRHTQPATTDDNAYITGLISVARDVAEKATGRAMLTQTWVAATQDWPSIGVLALSVAPVASISSVKYYAYGETSPTTLDPSNYVFASLTSPACIIFAESFSQPALADRPDAIQVTFVAGSTSASGVSPSLKHAIKILIRHFYDHPEAIGASMEEMPMHLRHLLESERVAGWVA